MLLTTVKWNHRNKGNNLHESKPIAVFNIIKVVLAWQGNLNIVAIATYCSYATTIPSRTGNVRILSYNTNSTIKYSYFHTNSININITRHVPLHFSAAFTEIYLFTRSKTMSGLHDWRCCSVSWFNGSLDIINE